METSIADLMSTVAEEDEPATSQSMGLNQVSEGDIVFAAQFDHMDDANHLRQLFEYFQMGFIDGCMIFTKEGIEYSNINGIRTLGTSFMINGIDISYKFNAGMERFVIGFSLANLAKVTRNVGKKHSLLLFHVRNENHVRYEILSMTVGGKSSHGRGVIPIKKNIEYETAELPGRGEQIASIPVAALVASCTILSNTTPVNHIRVICYRNGFKFQAINNADEVLNTQAFYPPTFRLMHGMDGTTLEVHKNAFDTQPGEQLLVFNVDRIIMKWMRKMVNIPVMTDRVRIYTVENKCGLIFEYNIARCGVAQTYLMQHESETS